MPYDEETFQYFLTLEKERSDRSGRPLLLLLLDLRKKKTFQEGFVQLDGLFEALYSGLRESDFVGWYRTGQVVGAVLTQPGEGVEAEACRVVRERAADALRNLRLDAALSVQVHQPHVEKNARTGNSVWP